MVRPPGCRGTGVELDEQVREPSSDGHGFTAGSAETSLWSRPPLCGDPRFGFRSPGPGARKDTERWGCSTPCRGGAATLRPGSRGCRAHGPRTKAGLRASRAGVWKESLDAGLRCRPQEAALAPMMGHSVSPEQLGESEGQTQEAQPNVGKSPTQHMSHRAHLLCNTVCRSNP